MRRLAAHPPGDPDPMLPAIAVAQEAVRWMPRAPFPVVAAVHGAAPGAGTQLAPASAPEKRRPVVTGGVAGSE